MNEKIDFVLLWVDGNDPKWLKEKEKYSSSKNLGTSNTKNRFRDWNNLQYWFRAVEKYSSWVNKIFFVTWGHVPSWLKENKKLQIVKHEDFIPKEYLPTFNSNTIILNLHRIKGLSENFVLFNDDMFLNDYVKETDFFINGIPRDQFSYNLISSTGNENDSFNHMLLNNIDIINKLGALVKIAEGLDRSLVGVVKKLNVYYDDEKVIITVSSPSNLDVEIHQALRGKNFFKEIYHRDLFIEKERWQN